jgi:hypothetical protein
VDLLKWNYENGLKYCNREAPASKENGTIERDHVNEMKMWGEVGGQREKRENRGRKEGDLLWGEDGRGE